MIIVLGTTSVRTRFALRAGSQQVVVYHSYVDNEYMYKQVQAKICPQPLYFWYLPTTVIQFAHPDNEKME